MIYMIEEKDKKDYVEVLIPSNLAEKIYNRIKDTGFTSISSYITYILEEVLSEIEDDKKFNSEDEKRVKERLRLLGYID